MEHETHRVKRSIPFVGGNPMDFPGVWIRLQNACLLNQAELRAIIILSITNISVSATERHVSIDTDHIV